MLRNTFLLVLFTLAASSAARADGVIEINQDCAAVGCFAGDPPGFPVNVQSAGHYRLTSDIVVGDDITAIWVSVDGDVHLDLNGFTIRGPVTCSGTPATCSASATGSCLVQVTTRGGTIRNGTLRGGSGRGVCGGFGWGFVLQDLLVSENAGDAISSGVGGNTSPNELVITNVRAIRNGGHGANFAYGNDQNHRITGSIFRGNGGDGVRSAGPLLVTDNFFQNNGGYGLAANYGNPLVALGRNVFFGNNGGNANPQYGGSMRDMGGNVCASATCP